MSEKTALLRFPKLPSEEDAGIANAQGINAYSILFRLVPHDEYCRRQGKAPCQQPRTRQEPDSMRLFIVEYDQAYFTSAFFSQADIAFPESIQRSVHKRQADFFFGRLAARNALSALGFSGEQVHIGTQRQPLWPHGVTGSITHTRSIAAAAAEWTGAYHGIGIDVEEVMDEETCSTTAAIVVNQSELDYLKSLPGLSLPVALTIVFSAKESFYKAVFGNVGRIFDFSAIHVVELNLQKQELMFMLAETLSADLRKGDPWSARFAFIRDDTVLTHIVW